MSQGNNDCYFYYYSNCTKGPMCTFRHEPAARGTEETCPLWLQGSCSKPRCDKRHMTIQRKRSDIQCYWETQPSGCQKAHCVFKHTLKQPVVEVPTPDTGKEEPKDVPSPKLDPLLINVQDTDDDSPVKPARIKPTVSKDTLGKKINLKRTLYNDDSQACDRAAIQNLQLQEKEVLQKARAGLTKTDTVLGNGLSKRVQALVSKREKILKARLEQKRKLIEAQKVWDADAAAAFPAKLAQPTQRAQQAQPTRRAQQAQPTRQAQQAQPNIEVKKADGITIIKPNKPIRQLYKKTSIQAIIPVQKEGKDIPSVKTSGEVKVKTFQEIMEEKRKRQQALHGGQGATSCQADSDNLKRKPATAPSAPTLKRKATTKSLDSCLAKQSRNPPMLKRKSAEESQGTSPAKQSRNSPMLKDRSNEKSHSAGSPVKWISDSPPRKRKSTEEPEGGSPAKQMRLSPELFLQSDEESQGASLTSTPKNTSMPEPSKLAKPSTSAPVTKVAKPAAAALTAKVAKPSAAAPIAKEVNSGHAAPVAKEVKPGTAAPVTKEVKPGTAGPVTIAKPAAAAPSAKVAKPGAAAPVAKLARAAGAGSVIKEAKPGAAAPTAKMTKPAAAAPVAKNRDGPVVSSRKMKIKRPSLAGSNPNLNNASPSRSTHEVGTEQSASAKHPTRQPADPLPAAEPAKQMDKQIDSCQNESQHEVTNHRERIPTLSASMQKIEKEIAEELDLLGDPEELGEFGSSEDLDDDDLMEEMNELLS